MKTKTSIVILVLCVMVSILLPALVRSARLQNKENSVDKTMSQKHQHKRFPGCESIVTKQKINSTRGICLTSTPKCRSDRGDGAKNINSDVWNSLLIRSVKSRKKRRALQLLNSDLISGIPDITAKVERTTPEIKQIRYQQADKAMMTTTNVSKFSKRLDLLLKHFHITGAIAGTSLSSLPRNSTVASEVVVRRKNKGLALKRNSVSLFSKQESQKNTRSEYSLKSLFAGLKNLEKNISDLQTQEKKGILLKRIETVISSIKKLKYKIKTFHAYRWGSNIDSLMSHANQVRYPVAKHLMINEKRIALFKAIIKQTHSRKLVAASSDPTKDMLKKQLASTLLKSIQRRKRRSLLTTLSSGNNSLNPPFRIESSLQANNSQNLNILGVTLEEKEKKERNWTSQTQSGTILTDVSGLISSVKASLDHNVDSLGDMLRPTAKIPLIEAKRREKVFVDEITTVLDQAEREIELFRTLLPEMTTEEKKIILDKIKHHVRHGISTAIKNYETSMLQNMSVL